MSKKNKYKSNKAPMIPAGVRFANSYEAAIKDRERFEEFQRSSKRKRIKKLKKGES